MKSFSLFYKEVSGNEGSKCHYPIRLNNYGCGCQHDCKYWEDNINPNKEDCCNLRR